MHFPVLLALFVRDLGVSQVSLTVGSSDSDVAQHFREWGIHHQQAKVNEAVIDNDNRFVSTPAICTFGVST